MLQCFFVCIFHFYYSYFYFCNNDPTAVGVLHMKPDVMNVSSCHYKKKRFRGKKQTNVRQEIVPLSAYMRFKSPPPEIYHSLDCSELPGSRQTISRSRSWFPGLRRRKHVCKSNLPNTGRETPVCSWEYLAYISLFNMLTNLSFINQHRKRTKGEILQLRKTEDRDGMCPTAHTEIRHSPADIPPHTWNWMTRRNKVAYPPVILGLQEGITDPLSSCVLYNPLVCWK